MEDETIEPLANQTQFAVEEASKEAPVSMVTDSAATSAPKAMDPQNKKLLLLIGVVVVLGLVSLVLLLPKRMPQVTQILQPSAAPIVNTTANPELKARIDELQKDLGNADPAKNTFTFPLVDMRLQLEKER